MKHGIGLLLLCSALLLAMSATAQAPLVRHTFDESDEGWTGMGTNARVTVSHQTTWNGAGALRFDYDVKPGVMGAMVLSTPDGRLAKAGAFRLWVYADYPTTVAFLLQEKGGARYLAPFAAPKRVWQKVELSPADFVPMEGPGNPPDADGRLDMGDVTMVAVADAGQLLGISGNADAAKLLGIAPGAHALYLDDFSVTTEALAPTVAPDGLSVRLDTFVRPQVNWLGLGALAATRVAGKPLAGAGLRADVHEAPGQIAALVRMVPRGRLEGMGQLTFTAASTNGMMLVVQLEERGGGKFSTTVDIPAGGAAKASVVAFADLSPAQDSTVKDRKLNPSLVTQVVILDPIGLTGIEEGRDNTLWIGDVVATVRP